MLLREYSIERWFAIPPLLTNVSALPGQTRTPKIGSLQSCCIPKMTHFSINFNNFSRVWAIIILFNFLCTFLTFCEMTKSEMTHFRHHWLFVSMPFAKDSKILIKILYNIKDYNANDLVWKLLSNGWNVGLIYKLMQKLQIAGSVCHRPDSGRRRCTRIADTLILFTNCYHTKVAKREILLAHCT